MKECAHLSATSLLRVGKLKERDFYLYVDIL